MRHDDVEAEPLEQLMEDVKWAMTADSSMHEEFWKGKRPHVFSLSYLCPFPTKPDSELDLLYREWDIESMFEIQSQHKFIGPLVVLVKQLILALTRWYMNPVIHEVKRINVLMARTLRDVNENIYETRERLAGLEEAEKELRERIARLEKAEDE